MATDFYVVPQQLTSLLSVVNIMLGSVGESPVAALDPSPSSTVDSALICIDSVDQLVQGMHGGWHWNSESAWQLTLDALSQAPLPDQTLAVTAAYFTAAQVEDFIQRGSLLYDRGNHTFVFKQAPLVDLVMRLSWDELPSQARLYITYVATELFHAQQQERQILLSVNNKFIEMALVALEQYDDLIAGRNSVQGNVTVASGLGGLGGLRRNRQGL